MLKKLFLINSILLLGASTLVVAQDFEIRDNPVVATTVGVTPDHVGTHDTYVDMVTYVKNVANDSMAFNWRNITDTTQNPPGWILLGICDNIICRNEYGPTWYYGNMQQTFPVAPSGSTIMEARIYASTEEPDGVGLFKIEISTAQQTDTLVYMLTKDTTTGISAISLTDKRVSIYPNPASGSDLHVYIDQNLKAAKATIYSIIGREQISLPVVKNKELTTFNVSNLPAGLYILRLEDNEGNTITSRKFTKQ